MRVKAKPIPENELDHTRDTLTDVVSIVGGTRRDVKILDAKVDDVKQQVVDVKQHLSRHDERFDHLELLIRQLIHKS